MTFEAHRLLRTKGGVDVGDVTFNQSLAEVGKLSEGDVAVSAFGGNQHQLIGLIQHQIRYDFEDSSTKISSLPSGTTVIPYNAMWDLLFEKVDHQDVSRVRKLKSVAKCAVAHIAPPPPKEDEAHIKRRHESAFSNAGILKHGISPAILRLKFWRLQTRILKEACEKMDVAFLMPPPKALTPEGFLAREYYADDATHANSAYGNLVFDQIEEVYGRK